MQRNELKEILFFGSIGPAATAGLLTFAFATSFDGQGAWISCLITPISLLATARFIAFFAFMPKDKRQSAFIHKSFWVVCLLNAASAIFWTLALTGQLGF